MNVPTTMAVLACAAGLIFAPALFGVINKTKAIFAGRKGPPFFQVYFDISKLLAKGAVFSRTTTWIFKIGPIVNLAAISLAMLLLPFGANIAVWTFPGDMFLLAGLLALGRFATILAALDTGSSFEGMGASREAKFGALSEPIFLLCLLALSRTTYAAGGATSLSDIYSSTGIGLWLQATPTLALVLAALFVLLLAENARIPVDDPNTHLELTMIHEVMVLDHGGPDLALITYASALKLWLFAVLVSGLVVPSDLDNWALRFGLHLGGVVIIGIIVGIVESTLARLAMRRVSHLLIGATALAVAAMALSLSSPA